MAKIKFIFSLQFILQCKKLLCAFEQNLYQFKATETCSPTTYTKKKTYEESSDEQ